MDWKTAKIIRSKYNRINKASGVQIRYAVMENGSVTFSYVPGVAEPSDESPSGFDWTPYRNIPDMYFDNYMTLFEDARILVDAARTKARELGSGEITPELLLSAIDRVIKSPKRSRDNGNVLPI